MGKELLTQEAMEMLASISLAILPNSIVVDDDSYDLAAPCKGLCTNSCPATCDYSCTDDY